MLGVELLFQFGREYIKAFAYYLDIKHEKNIKFIINMQFLNFALSQISLVRSLILYIKPSIDI